MSQEARGVHEAPDATERGHERARVEAAEAGHGGVKRLACTAAPHASSSYVRKSILWNTTIVCGDTPRRSDEAARSVNGTARRCVVSRDRSTDLAVVKCPAVKERHERVKHGRRRSSD